ncbi:H+ symporter family protein [Biscogniauxia sp. FL1348]|nr:H+ symporter family protein [Biscogniauxia sp. FL1348]
MTIAEDEANVYPPHHGMSAGTYLATRISSLKPPMTKAPNPIRLLRMLDRHHWAFFSIAFIAWTWDAFDFFTVSLTVHDLAETFDRSNTDITWGITLVLMLRSIGSIVFGIAADRYGRKWPFIINNLLFIILELPSRRLHPSRLGAPGFLGLVRPEIFLVPDLGTGFCQTYSQFLACRALFGVAMGGLYGNAAATALEDLPNEARGLMSGMLQQGYAFGYLLAAAFSRALVNTTPHSWRPLFWFGACPPVIFILWRLYLPETNTYIAHQEMRRANGNIGKTFVKEGKVALKHHWLMLTYLVLLMAGFNFMSHGSQDLYPTMLQNQLSFSADQVTITQVVANLGAMSGGTVVGFCSQIFGRRLSIIVMCIIGGALLYPYTFVYNERIIAAAFFEQFCVQGAWGVIPVHLMELSPGAFRTFVVGTSYQLGNLVSSASSTIEATIGERFPLPTEEAGESRYNYGIVICIFMGCVYAYVILLTLIGPEHLNRNMDVGHDTDAAEATGHAVGDLKYIEHDSRAVRDASVSEDGDMEKGTATQTE